MDKPMIAMPFCMANWVRQSNYVLGLDGRLGVHSGAIWRLLCYWGFMNQVSPYYSIPDLIFYLSWLYFTCTSGFVV